jgi:SAM-dependent methyltransferase
MTTPAETYERFMVPVLFEPLAHQLLEIARPQAGERILDVGCGTGIVARRVAAALGPEATVTAIDRAPPMLEVARKTSEHEGVHIQWLEGSAEDLPLPDETFDLVLSQAALMFFTDPPQAVVEMHRVMKPNARVAISVFQSIEQHPFYQALHHLIEDRLGNSGVADIFALGNSDHLRTLLERAAFHDVEIVPVSVTANFGPPEQFIAGEIEVDTAAIPAMQHLNEQERAALRATIREQMTEPLNEVTTDGEVVITFHAQIARGYC